MYFAFDNNSLVIEIIVDYLKNIQANQWLVNQRLTNYQMTRMLGYDEKYLALGCGDRPLFGVRNPGPSNQREIGRAHV